MKLASNILGIFHGDLNRPRPWKPTRNHQKAPPHGGPWTGPQHSVLPTSIYKRRAAGVNQEPGNPSKNLECSIFTCLDLTYQLWPPERKREWRLALKKPGMSGYDLWMKEALSQTLIGLPPPDHPSRSGGWSCRYVVPGSDRHCIEHLLDTPLRRAWLEYHPSTGPGDHAFWHIHTLWHSPPHGPTAGQSFNVAWLYLADYYQTWKIASLSCLRPTDYHVEDKWLGTGICYGLLPIHGGPPVPVWFSAEQPWTPLRWKRRPWSPPPTPPHLFP